MLSPNKVILQKETSQPRSDRSGQGMPVNPRYFRNVWGRRIQEGKNVVL